MRPEHLTYTLGDKTPRSLGQMIRDQEWHRTMRILNPEGPQPRQRSFSERYREEGHTLSTVELGRN